MPSSASSRSISSSRQRSANIACTLNSPTSSASWLHDVGAIDAAARRRQEMALAGPLGIRRVIAPLGLREALGGQPAPGQQVAGVRKPGGEAGQVGRGRQVETEEASLAPERRDVDLRRARQPVGARQERRLGVDRPVEIQQLERRPPAGHPLRLLGGNLEFLEAPEVAERRVDPVPDVAVEGVVVRPGGVDGRVKRRILDRAVDAPARRSAPARS